MFALRVVGGVVLAVGLKAGGEFGLQGGGVLGLGVPVDVERLDLRAEEMVGAARAEFGEAGGVLRVHEAQDLGVVLHGADEAFLAGNLAAQPREDAGEDGAAPGLVEGLVLRAPEGGGVAALRGVLRLDVGGGLLDEVERERVAGLVVVVPRDEAVLAHHDGLDARVLLRDFLHGEAEFEARAHPRHVGHLAAEDFLGEFHAVGRGRDGDDRVRVHVVDVLAREEGVERRVDRGGARVEVEGRVRVHADHVVLGRGLQALVGARGVDLLQGDELVLVEGGEVLARAGAEIAAGALDPEHLGGRAGERVLLGELGRRVAAAGVGDALVAAEEVRAVDEAGDGIEGRRLGVVPAEIDEFVGAHGWKVGESFLTTDYTDGYGLGGYRAVV